MIKAVIFDCFGVLISDGLERVCRRLEVEDPEARSFISETIRLNNSGLIDPVESNQRIADYLHIDVADWRAQVHEGESRDIPVFELVKSLRPQYKTALLSNIGKGSLARRFSDEELEDLFDVVVTSAHLGTVKPDPVIYKHTAERLGVEPEECVFLDDREGYCDAARDVGMQTIWFRGYEQAKPELDNILQG